MANTNLNLDLHSSSPEPVNFFGAQSSLGGGTIFVWGDGPGMPSRGAGPALAATATAAAEEEQTLAQLRLKAIELEAEEKRIACG